MTTYDCAPTLTDSEVLEFCKNGYLMLEGVVPEEVNRRTLEYVDAQPQMEPTEILKEAWFHDNVTINPVAAGAVRSLLGKDFHLPILMSNHRIKCPAGSQGWHVDGNFDFKLVLPYLQVFYYPQETPAENGPTEVVPGSHLVKNIARGMQHYDRIGAARATAAPAGSIFLTAYQIWHRRSRSTADGVRNLLKYFYWRTQAPTRDWIVEPDFDPATANYETPADQMSDQFRGCNRVAELFTWLCGKGEHFQNLGGQSWPLPAHRLGTSYGYPTELGTMG
ncbi:MAG: phytanoyl-CoA dioxygenase family protein [Planctomycetota bacterium]|nr:phytanoyl-CoA dioxygenase family protein [Planctomycetota bacterium]MDP7249041.1 phytanoyl-CoA dioxygenase family protein [Planctomycetota bacterium]